MCEELERIRGDAASALLEAKRIRRARDLSFKEDAELSREGQRKVDDVIMHLLVGHGGKPCPGGTRPIVNVSQGKRDSSVKSAFPLRNSGQAE